MSKLTKMIAAASAAAVFMATAPVMAAETLIEEFNFDFQPHVTDTGPMPVQKLWTIDTEEIYYGASQDAAKYFAGILNDDTIGPGGGIEGQNIPNFVMRAGLLDLVGTDDSGDRIPQSGSRYVNLLFGDNSNITPGIHLTEGVARVEFDWKATITGTDDTMDTYFIGPDGVKYFGVRASYHSNSKDEPWDNTIDFIDGGPARERPLTDPVKEAQERPQEWYHALLPDNQWYRISVTLDFETHRIIEVTYRMYASAEEPYFEENPVVTLKDLPFVDEYDEDAVPSVGIGAVRLESIRNTGNIEAMDWNVDNFKAYDVTDEYHKVTLTLSDGEQPVEGAGITLSGEDFESKYITGPDGKIQTKLAPGAYAYSAAKVGYPKRTGSITVETDDVDETIDFNAISYVPEPKAVEISGGQSSLTAPHTDANESYTSAPYTVKVTDQEGVERADYTVKWDISPADEHVSIDENTGAVTVTKDFDGGTAGIKTFTVTPTVTIGDKSNSDASAEIEISDYLFYDSGKNGSSYGDPDTPPRAHQIGGDGVYMTTSEGGDWGPGETAENHTTDGRNYKGIINLPEPIEFTPDSVYEMTFETTSTADVYTFGRSLILSDEREEPIPDEGGGDSETGDTGDTGEAGDTEEPGGDIDGTGDAGVTGDTEEPGGAEDSGEPSDTGDAGEAGDIGGTEDSGETGDTGDTGETGSGGTRIVDADFLTIDYIHDGIGKRHIEDPENPQWHSDDNTFETVYGTLEDYNIWKPVSILFTTDSAGETTAAITIDGTTTDLGVMDAERLVKMKLSIEICRTVTDRFAALRNVAIREIKPVEPVEPIEFEVGEQYAGQEAQLILARYNEDGSLADVEARGATLDETHVINGKYTVETTDIAKDTKVMLWIKDKYIPVAPAQTVR